MTEAKKIAASLTEADAQFVREARQKWNGILDLAETKDGHTAALAVSLWATLHVDRLIDIASRQLLER